MAGRHLRVKAEGAANAAADEEPNGLAFIQESTIATTPASSGRRFRPDQHAREPAPAKAGVVGWQTLATKPIDRPIDLAA
jgi:hypothetical protein